MPSPFPGMDPYFEGELWQTFHTELGVEVAHQLTPKLAPRYIARPEKRFFVANDDDVGVELEIIPDVGVRQIGGGPTALRGKRTPAPLEMATVIPRKISQVWVAIRDVANRKLVTAIEFLLPTNKRSAGRKMYLRKRARILRSSVHLLEIDLIRSDKRLPMRKQLPSVPYFVFLARAERLPLVGVWPIAFDQPLPLLPIPLLPGDEEVELDLQAAFAGVYDASRYDLEIDYAVPPEVPLPPDMRRWAERCTQALRKKK